MTHLTFSELERAAYISGNVVLSNAYAAMLERERIEDALNNGQIDIDSMLEAGDISPQLEDLQSEFLKNNSPDYDAYKQFFDDCFEQLGAHYPCPEVTSNRDCAVIFEAIRKGEGVAE